MNTLFCILELKLLLFDLILLIDYGSNLNFNVKVRPRPLNYGLTVWYPNLSSKLTKSFESKY